MSYFCVGKGRGKEGKWCWKSRTGQALDSTDYLQLISNTRSPMIRSQEQVNGSSYHHNQSAFCALVASGPNMHNDSNKVRTEIPSELITPCVAT
ncbi:unnamed protein product [Lupinus luteus]|uniref:Uncharacterized protein n=1 Tax=Lupinus luteus TaxID=3873 RepID=A0AAV1VSV4_LUPLU